MKTKRKGNQREHKTMALLEAAGYRCVRSGGSLGEWDVVGIGPQGVVLVQVKSSRNPGTLEMAALRESCPWPHVTRLVHVWKNWARTPMVTEL